MEPEDDYQNEDSQDGMHPMKKVGRINLIILLVYAGVFLASSVVFARGEAMSAWLIWTGLAMLAQGGVNLALGVIFFIVSKPELGKGALLSGLVLLVIGFSTCVAAFSTISFH